MRTLEQTRSFGSDQEAVPGGSVEVDPAVLRAETLDHLLYTCMKDRSEASAADLYRALAHTVRDRLVQRWMATQRTHFEQDAKRAYYLSSEFLTGRSLGLCLLNLGLYAEAEKVAGEWGLILEDVLEQEGDPGLGNGGLGRLAACFMDSLATLELPAVGYGIRYDFGIFEQRIEDGQQVEHRDNWLEDGNPWELPQRAHAQTVRFYGHVETRLDENGRSRVEWLNARHVIGLPYDSFIVGHETDNVNTLRLWAARASRDFDLKLFNAGDYRRAVEEKVDVESISKVLYPDDHTEEGKELRLKQQYFFVACSLADIVQRYKMRHTTFAMFPERVAIQLNDTHPAIAVAELMRIFVDQEHLDWHEAWKLTERTFGYTNHTLLPEALERWSVSMFERVLPRHLSIIYEINHHFLRQVHTRWPGDLARLERMSIVEEGPVKLLRMAYLATVGSHSINGVAKLHSQLVQDELLADFFALWPERFNNKTNGVTPRRWLLYANPELSKLLSARLGGAFMHHDLCELKRLAAQADDPELQDALWQIKHENKQALSRLIKSLTGVTTDPASMFVVQVKRIHEYKRQLLACLQIIAHYLRLKQHPERDEVPRTYIFAGKAAAGYATAKLHIRLINDIAHVINADPRVSDRLKIVFVPNYGVSLAQVIVPAADVSLQISQAGKEASGTSNMKFALNGALTLGTLDGANVEIRDAVGHENFFLFGMKIDEVKALAKRGYEPGHYIGQSAELGRVLSLLETDFFSLGEPTRYRDLVRGLREHDPYMVCADFDAYVATEARAADLFRTPRAWSRAAAFNIAGASEFSSDATILQYAREIWDVKPVKADLRLEDSKVRREGRGLTAVIRPR